MQVFRLSKSATTIGRRISRNTKYILPFLIATFLLIHWPPTMLPRPRSNTKRIDLLQPLRDEEVPPNESIFFIETNDEILRLNPRVVCAAESAARWNPTKTIFIIVRATVGRHLSRAEIGYLAQLGDIRVRSVNVSELSLGSPVEQLWHSGRLAQSRYFLSHCSDMLRFLLVHRFGGVYFDQDVISLATLPAGLENFLVAERGDMLASAVFRMRRGNKVLSTVLKLMSVTFDGNNWDHNGPRTLTNVAMSLCRPQQGYLSEGENIVDVLATCFNYFYILPKERVSPIPSEYYRQFYTPSLMNVVRYYLRKSFVVHYFNKMRTGVASQEGDKDSITMSQDQPLYQTMKQNCPNTEAVILRSLIGGQY